MVSVLMSALVLNLVTLSVFMISDVLLRVVAPNYIYTLKDSYHVSLESKV